MRADDQDVRDEARKHNALARLAIARRERLGDKDYEVYLDELADESADVVERACRRLGRTPRAEFQTAMPDVGTVLAACLAVRQSRAALALTEHAAHLKQLHERRPPEMTTQEARAFIDGLKARVEAKRGLNTLR